MSVFRDALLRVLTRRRGGQTDAEREAWLDAAKPIAFSGNVYAEFTAVLRRQGHAGDERTAELLYTALTSRLLPRPMSALVRVPPQTQPSVVDRVVRLFPEDQVEIRSGFSARAIAYNWRDLRHKALVVREAGALSARDGGMLMQGLTLERRIHWEAPRWSGGSPMTTDITREGPLALLMMTAHETVRPELGTVRALPVTIENAPGHDAAEIDEISREFAGGHADHPTELDPWRAFQEILETMDCRVVVPFAPALGRLFRDRTGPTRRLYAQLLAAVATSALLHTFTRERDADGAVIATLDDYAHARRMLEQPFADAASIEVPDGVQELLDVLSDNTAGHGLSLSELATKMNVDRTTAQRRAQKAKALGLAVDLAGGQGRRCRLVAVERTPGDKCALPEARTLAAELRPEEILPPASEAPDSAETETPVDPEVFELPELDDAEGEVPETATSANEPATGAPDTPPILARTANDSPDRSLIEPEAPPTLTLPLKGGGKEIAAPALPPIVARAPNPKSLTGGYRRREDQFKFRAAMQEMIGRRWNGDDKLTCVGNRAADSARS